MLVATKTFRTDDGELIRKGVDRVIQGHELASKYPDSFEVDPEWSDYDGPVSRVTAEAPVLREPTSTRSASRRRAPRTTVRSQRLPLEEEDRRRRERIAELDAEDKARFETESTRRTGSSGRRPRPTSTRSRRGGPHSDGARSARTRTHQEQRRRYRALLPRVGRGRLQELARRHRMELADAQRIAQHEVGSRRRRRWL